MGILDISDEGEEGLVEAEVSTEKPEAEIKLQLMVAERYADVEKILNRFRRGKNIILIKVTPIRRENMKDLKKVTKRLKSHCKVTGAELAALDDNWLILVPPAVKIEREKKEE